MKTYGITMYWINPARIAFDAAKSVDEAIGIIRGKAKKDPHLDHAIIYDGKGFEKTVYPQQL